eukprot:13279189-Alexandrium_andersonii.AAC.1
MPGRAALAGRRAEAMPPDSFGARGPGLLMVRGTGPTVPVQRPPEHSVPARTRRQERNGVPDPGSG